MPRQSRMFRVCADSLIKWVHGDNLELAKAVNNIGDGIRKAVETSMKDEKMKADLITNVSHDIKTPEKHDAENS